MAEALADPVTVTRRGAVAIVTIDNPPDNALRQRVRAGLLLAIAETEADPSVRAVVLTGAGDRFAASTDPVNFDRPPAEPHLPAVVRAIEEATKPWVAAIAGRATGGGLELALGCHYRVAAPGARLSLPDVTLGLIPGAGGAVRLLRLVAPAEALALLAEGRAVDADKARALGLVDAVAGDDLLAEAVALAEEAVRRELPLPLPARAPSGVRDATFEAAAERVLARARGQVAPAEAVAALRGCPRARCLRGARQRAQTLPRAPRRTTGASLACGCDGRAGGDPGGRPGAAAHGARRRRRRRDDGGGDRDGGSPRRAAGDAHRAHRRCARARYRNGPR